MGGIVDSVFGGGGDASDAMEDAARRSEDVQRYMYDTAREDMQPWREAGQNALAQLTQLHGIYSPTVAQQQAAEEAEQPTMAAPTGPVTPLDFYQLRREYAREVGPYMEGPISDNDFESWLQQRKPDIWAQLTGTGEQPREAGPVTVNGETGEPLDRFEHFYASPDYQFRMDEGIRALDRSAAARGRLFSGAQGRELTRYGQGLASTEYGNYYNRLAQLAGVGQTASQYLGGLGAQAGQGISNAIMAGGQGRASGYLASGQANQSLLGTGLSALGMFGGLGGGGLGGAMAGGFGGMALPSLGGGATAASLFPSTMFAALSDRNMKTDISDLNCKECYEAVMSMPLKVWRYLEEAGLDTDMHFGPMAQDAPEMIKVDGKEMLSIHDELMMIAGAIQYMRRQ